jgi:hypothetical protein
MTLETSTSGTRSVKLLLPQIASLASIASLIVFIVGFASGYLAFKSEMTALRETVSDLRKDNAGQQDHLNSLDVRLTSLGGDLKYISQGVAELRLANVPKH